MDYCTVSGLLTNTFSGEWEKIVRVLLTAIDALIKGVWKIFDI
jgi:hypothetical protein